MAGQDAHLQGVPGSYNYIPGWRPQRYQEVPMERLGTTPGHRAAEFGIDLFSLGKNWGNYGLGAHIRGDPRYFMGKGIQLPFQALGQAGKTGYQMWNQGAAQTGKDMFSRAGQFMNAPANIRGAYNTYKATQESAGLAALGPKAWVLSRGFRGVNPFVQAMQGMGYGNALNLVDEAGKLRPLSALSATERATIQGVSTLKRNLNALRGVTKYTNKVPGTGLIPNKFTKLRWMKKSVPGLGKLKAGVSTAGRVLGAFEGLRYALQEPAEEAYALWKSENAEEDAQIMRAGSQGRWAENYKRAKGLIQPDMNRWVDKNKDGYWDKYEEGHPKAGEKIPNPNLGKKMIGFDWTGRTEVNPTFNKYMQQALLGMESGQYATQEMFAGGADFLGSIARKLGLAENPQWGKKFSDYDRDMRWGYDLTEGQPLSDYYTEGTYENLKGRLPNAERGLKAMEEKLRQGGGERFAAPNAEEVEQDLPREQLVNFFVDHFTSEKDRDGNEIPMPDRVRQVRGMLETMPREKYLRAVKDLQEKAYTPEGDIRVEDEEVQRRQVYGWLLEQHGHHTQDSSRNAFLTGEDGKNVPLSELPNEVQRMPGKDGELNTDDDISRWTVDGRPVGHRDFRLEAMRIRQNKVYAAQVQDYAQEILDKGRNVISPSKAWELAIAEKGSHPTMFSRIQAAEGLGQWAKDHPSLTHDVIREELQSKISELPPEERRSPYHPDVIRKQMLDRDQINQMGRLHQLRQEVKDLPAQIESKRDVTAGITYNESSYEQVGEQRATAIARMHELNEERPQDPEKLKEWHREFYHNKGIIDAANNFQTVFRENMTYWKNPITGSFSAEPRSGHEKVRQILRVGASGAGTAIHRLEKYNSVDKTPDILQTINRNKGRRAFWDALKDRQAANQFTADLEARQALAGGDRAAYSRATHDAGQHLRGTPPVASSNTVYPGSSRYSQGRPRHGDR